MDNIQDSVQPTPQGQVEPAAEQVPDVQTDEATSEASQGPTITFDELAAKKGFKSPDELAKAYANLESHSTKVSQDKAEMEKLFFIESQENREKQAPIQNQSIDEQALQELDKFVNERVKKEVHEIRKEWQDRESRRELRELIEKNNDFGKYAQDVKDIKSKYPEMSFAEALTFAKATAGQLIQQGRSEGMQQATQAALRQRQAQTLPSKQGAETERGIEDLLQGAGSKWKIGSSGRANEKTRAEIELIEKELFGKVLQKTDMGL